MVLLDMAAKLSRDIGVITLDTGRLPEETFTMIDTVRRRYGIAIETVTPDPAEVASMVARHGPNLFHDSVPQRMLCCQIRKVRPLERRLASFDAWVTGLRRGQNGSRADILRIDETARPVKINPLADWSDEEVDKYIRENDVPLHPLYSRGYGSIGCAPCTRPGSGRDGRWWWEADADKECGIHFSANGKAERSVDVLLRDIVAPSSLRQKPATDETVSDRQPGINEIQARTVDTPVFPPFSPRTVATHQGFTLWFTGLSGAGKSTISAIIERSLREGGARVEVLDGDVVRTHLSKGLGFSKEDRDTNVRRIGFVAELLSRHGAVAIVAAISPYRAVRDEVRSRIPNFVEVYVECPIEVLAERDVKGLYKRALAGEIPSFTGVSDPYEPPLAPDVVVNSSRETPEQSAAQIWATLEHKGLVTFPLRLAAD